MAIDTECIDLLLASLQRFYRDVRLLRLYEGATQFQQLIIGRELVGRD